MDETKNAKTPPIERVEDFITAYANNVRFESTIHDLTLVFGQSDLGTGKEILKQHTAITLPWTVVKLCLHFLKVNLAVHELYNGAVPVAPNQIPPIVPKPSAEEIATDPKIIEANELINRLRDEFASVQKS